MEEAARGSDLLKRRYSERDLKDLLEIAQIDGVRIADFFPIGIPAPDGGWGVLRVKPEVIGSLLEKLLTLEQIPNIKVFPRGIPRPDIFDVHIEAGSRRAF